jgi:hypothetical protein
MTKLLVLFHSFYGDVYRLGEAVRERAASTGAEVALKQVPETVPEEVLVSSGAAEAKKAFAHVEMATIAELPEYDGIAFGTGTRFGNMTSTMRSFLDQTGQQLVGWQADKQGRDGFCRDRHRWRSGNYGYLNLVHPRASWDGYRASRLSGYGSSRRNGGPRWVAICRRRYSTGGAAASRQDRDFARLWSR